jgi:hypothetical protein
MTVWLVMTREEGAANPTPKVMASADLAHNEIVRFAREQEVHPDEYDLEHDEHGRILWFENISGDGPEAWVDGPLEVHLS